MTTEICFSYVITASINENMKEQNYYSWQNQNKISALPVDGVKSPLGGANRKDRGRY